MTKCKVCGRKYFGLACTFVKHGTCGDCRQWYELCRAWRNFSRRLRQVVRDTEKRARYARTYGYRGDW